MAREVFAPWAEVVPGAGPMTVDELLQLPDDGWRYELVDGVLVRMPPPGFRHGRLVARLASTLLTYVTANHLGDVVTDAGFVLSRAGQPDTVLGPDVAFVRTEHLPQPDSSADEKHLRVAPDLAAEIASPDQYRPDMRDKATMYLASGVRLVWVVWPDSKTVDVWRPGSDTSIQTLALSDALDGLDVLPGFSYPLAELFA
jgi:Uma2 family endonuclease